MREHLRVLAWLYLASGGVVLLLGVLVALLFGVAGFAAGDGVAAVTLGSVAVFVGMLLLVLSIPSLVCGWGLLYGRGWSRPLGIVLSALHLPSFPLGTALGAYGLWVLLNDESRRLLESGEVARIATFARGGGG